MVPKSYQVIARKWRPQQFEEVVGQKTITRTLQNAIRLGRIAHAYLFTGTRGVGKTSTARILAKALNCHQGPTPNPCDACPSCLEIAQGNAIDVLEIDAASNRGIGEIRELRENVQYAPSRDRHKIFIIDEVHMLTTEAFNALLKTLEEPPAHVIFILATTELYKIPQTIVSRCQQFDFRIIPFDEIYERLRSILAEEGTRITDQSLRFVVKASGGSMRDAESALQKIVSLGGEGVSDEDVSALLGVVQQDFLNQTMRMILNQDHAGILDLIDRLYDRGHDLQNFLRAFMEFVRHVIVHKVTGSQQHLLFLSEEDIAVIREIAGQLTVEEFIRHYDLLLQADNQLRWTPFVRFHVEMAFLKLASLPKLASLEQILTALQEAPISVRPATPAAGPPVAESAPKQPAPSAGPPSEPNPDRDRIRIFRDAIGKQHAPLKAMLPHVEFHLSGRRLEIVVPENTFYERNFRHPNTQKQLEEIFIELFQTTPEITIRTKTRTPENHVRQEDTQRLREEQKRVEALFMEDRVARALIDKVSGKWIFKRQP